MHICQARVVSGDQVLGNHCVQVENGRICAITPGEDCVRAAAGPVFAARGRVLLPGFIDLHFHGCLGRDLMDMDEAHWLATSRFLAASGVTGFLATYTASPAEQTSRFLGFAADRGRERLPGAQLLGVHLEGPYVNPGLAGMMPRAWLRAPDAREYCAWLDTGTVRRMTGSLELPGGEALLADCLEAGVTFSLGHSLAGADEVRRWADQGLACVTHLYNAMSRAEKRGPLRRCGCVEAALLDERITAEVIGDGLHVPEHLFLIALRCKGDQGLFVSSDSTPATGAAREGVPFRYGGDSGETLIVREGMALSADGSYLVGSICLLGGMVKRMHGWLDGDWPAIARLLSANAARVIGMDGRKGTVAPGMDADLVLVDDSLSVAAAWVAGELVHG